MANLDDILNERFATATETPAETATTETTPVETVTEEAGQATTETQEEATVESSTLTEVTETPTSETPATTEAPATTPEVKNESPLDALFQKLGVKSEDEISARFTELQTIKEKNTLGKLIDTLSEKGIDPITAVTFHKLDVAALTPKEKIAWDIKMQHPTLSDEKISALIEEEYGDENNLAQQAKLEIKAEEAGKKLLEQKVKILDPTLAKKENELKQLEAEKAELQRVEGWKTTPKVKELIAGLTKIEEKVSFSSLGKDKPENKSFNFAYQIPKEALEKAEVSLRNIAIANGYDLNDPKSIDGLKQMAENLYWLENKGNVLRSLANTVASQLHKEYAVRNHNATPKGGGAFIDTGTKSEAERRLEATINTL